MFTLQIKLHPLLRHNADYYRKFLLFYEGETVMVHQAAVSHCKDQPLCKRLIANTYFVTNVVDRTCSLLKLERTIMYRSS